MTFTEILTQILDQLQREGRVSYRALKRQFALDDDYLEDIKAELIDAKRLAVDEDSKVLVWTGSSASSVQSLESKTLPSPDAKPKCTTLGHFSTCCAPASVRP